MVLLKLECSGYQVRTWLPLQEIRQKEEVESARQMRGLYVVWRAERCGGRMT